MTLSASPRIELDGTVFSPAQERNGSPVSFTLKPGRVLWLVTGPEEVEHVGDVLLGLEEPAAGRVRMEGRDWQGLTADEQAAQRAAIRRVFSHKGWISQLDMEENFTLALRHHGERETEGLLEEYRDLCRKLGLEWSMGYPEHIHPRRLHPLQWVRALGGRADLLVIGLRRELFASGLEKKLLEILGQRIEDGLSVIWVGSRVPDGLWGVPDPSLCDKISLM